LDSCAHGQKSNRLRLELDWINKKGNNKLIRPCGPK
jgi:hypothetical protein